MACAIASSEIRGAGPSGAVFYGKAVVSMRGLELVTEY